MKDGCFVVSSETLTSTRTNRDLHPILMHVLKTFANNVGSLYTSSFLSLGSFVWWIAGSSVGVEGASHTIAAIVSSGGYFFDIG